VNQTIDAQTNQDMTLVASVYHRKSQNKLKTGDVFSMYLSEQN